MRIHRAKLTIVRWATAWLCSSWRHTTAKGAEKLSSAGGNLGIISERVKGTCIENRGRIQVGECNSSRC